MTTYDALVPDDPTRVIFDYRTPPPALPRARLARGSRFARLSLARLGSRAALSLWRARGSRLLALSIPQRFAMLAQMTSRCSGAGVTSISKGRGERSCCCASASATSSLNVTMPDELLPVEMTVCHI